MNETKRDFGAIPAGACVLTVGEFALGDNGASAKSAPVRLVARTGKAIEHWFWGRVIHDLAGMHLHKSRIPIDYVHDSKEIIGYLNKFDVSSGDLVTSGALVPFKDSDRATEIVHKSKAGVPYEASINFGGEGIKVQVVAEKEFTQVNGQQFDGPGVVIREWPLRGVAICPYGADMNTESKTFGNSNQVFSAAVVTAPEATTKETQMKSQSVEVAAAVETPKAEEVQTEMKQQPVEAKPAEAAPVVPENTPPAPVEAKPSEGTAMAAPVAQAEPPKQEEKKPEDKPEEEEQFSRAEFCRIADAFGNDIAAKTVRDGGDYVTAQADAFSATKKQNDELLAKLAELEHGKMGGTPAAVTAAKKPAKLFKTEK